MSSLVQLLATSSTQPSGIGSRGAFELIRNIDVKTWANKFMTLVWCRSLDLCKAQKQILAISIKMILVTGTWATTKLFGPKRGSFSPEKYSNEWKIGWSDYPLIGLQRSAKRLVRGCGKFVPALAYLFCLGLPGSCIVTFAYLLAGLCTFFRALSL